MTLLAGELAEAVNGAGRTVIVDGVSGVGKSRLLREFAHLATAKRCQVLRVNISEHHSFGVLVRAMVEQLLRLLRPPTESDRHAKKLLGMFSEGARRTADWLVKLGPALGALPSDPATLAAWFAAGTVGVPMLTHVLDGLKEPSEGSTASASGSAVSGMLDAIEQISQELDSAKGERVALVLAFDQWDHLARRTPTERQACEELALALHNRLRSLHPRQVLVIFGVRSEARAETIGQVHNSPGVRPILVNPLSRDACLELLCEPLNGRSCPGAFTADAASACYEDCKGNAEHLVLLASDVWTEASRQSVFKVDLAFYQRHAPSTIARAVASRVERFQRQYQDQDTEAMAVLVALANGLPDQAWRAGDLIQSPSSVQPDLVRSMLKALARPETGILEYRVPHGARQGAYWFQHDLRWRGLRQWCFPDETGELRDRAISIRRLRDLLRSDDERLDSRDRVRMCSWLAEDARHAGDGTALSEAIAELADLVDDDDHVVRLRALATLAATRAQEAAAPVMMALTDPDPDVRQAAVRAAGDLGLIAAVGDLKALLARPAERLPVRLAAIDALGDIAAEETFPILQAMLHDSEKLVRRKAAQALAASPSPDAALALSPLLKDEDPVVRWTVTGRLVGERDPLGLVGLVRELPQEGSDLGDKVADLVSEIPPFELHRLLSLGLRDARPGVRSAALDLAVRLGQPDRLSSLTALVHDRDPVVRAAAARAVGRADLPDPVPLLVEALTDEESSVRDAAATAARELASPGFVHALEQHLRHPDGSIRRQSVIILGAVASEQAIALLLSASADDDAGVRQQIVVALRQTRRVDLMDVLTGALADNDPRVRREAAAALCETASAMVGAKTHPSRPAATVSADLVTALMEAMADPDGHVRAYAIRSLGVLAVTRAKAMILESLHDRCGEVRQAAAWAVGRRRHPEAATALLAAMGDSDAEVRVAAATSLLGLPIPIVLRAAGAAPEDSRTNLRRELARFLSAVPQVPSLSAAVLLAELGTDAEAAVLARAFGDPNVRVRRAVAQGLAKFGTAAEARTLADAIRDSDTYVRRAAARGLAAFGTAAEGAAMADAFYDSDVQVRSAGAQGLVRLAGAIPIAGLLRESIEGKPQRHAADHYQSGASMLEQVGDWDGAVMLLKEGIERVPPAQAGPLYQSCAGMLERTGKVDEAAALLKEAIRRMPAGQAYWPLYQSCAGMLARAGKVAEAAALLKEAITQMPAAQACWPLYQSCAEILARHSRVDEAVALLREGIAQAPSAHAGPLYQSCAGMLARAGKVAEAAALLKQAIRQVPTKSAYSLCQSCAEMLARVGRVDEAVTVLKEGIERMASPQNQCRLYCTCARMLAHAGRAAEAVTLLRNGLERVPPTQSRWSLYESCAEILARHDKVDEAVALLKEGIERLTSPQNQCQLRCACANVLARAGRNNEAVVLLREAIEQVPAAHAYPLYQSWAEMLTREGKVEEVVALLRDGTERVTALQSRGLYQLCADILRQAGRDDEALALLRESDTRVPPA